MNCKIKYFKKHSNKLSLVKMAVSLFLIAQFVVNFPSRVFAQKPVIIEYGWDYPDINKLSNSLDSMQNTPFDGICFSLRPLVIHAFDTIAQKEPYFEYDKLKALKWGKYTDNYLLLFGFSKSGGNWYNDKVWQAIDQNMTGLSKAMLVGKLKGILFDAEYDYADPFFDPWTYSEKQYPNKSFEEVKNQVRKRGIEFIQSLQLYTSNFSFLSIWLTSLIVEDLKYGPIEKTRHALLLPFMEGVLLGKKNTVKVIDGNEYAYWHYRPSQFLASTDFLKKNTIALMKTKEGKKLATSITTAQPIFFDGIIANHKDYQKGVPYLLRWKWLEENLKYVIATSTSNTIWFYSQKVDWWRGKINDTLNDIVTRSKIAFLPMQKNKLVTTIQPIQPKCNNVNSGIGYYYFADAKKPMETGTIAFTFSWNSLSKIMKLKYLNKLPDSVNIYVNNSFLLKLYPKSGDNSIPLNKFVKGKIAILAKYENNVEACGLQVY